MESIGAFIRPETYLIGNREKFVSQKGATFKKPVMETVTGQYVPIWKTVSALNSRTYLIEQAFINAPCTEDGCYRSYFDGSKWSLGQH